MEIRKADLHFTILTMILRRLVSFGNVFKPGKV